MLGTTMRRRRVANLSAAAALALALTLAGCARKDGATTSPTGGGNAALGNAPSGSATASPGTSPGGGTSTSTSTDGSTSPGGGTSTGTGGGGSGGGNSGPPYPGEAKSYGLEILKAVGAKDHPRLGTLADANTVNYSKQYANKNASWTYVYCEVSGVQTNCYYYNQAGDVAQVGMITAKLGKIGAGTLVYLDVSEFRKNPTDYVAAFVAIWTYGGTYARVVSLSSPSIADHFINGVGKLSAGGGGTTTSAPHPCATNSGKTCVDASVVGGSLNLPVQHFIIDPSKVSAGKPNGIIGYEPQT